MSKILLITGPTAIGKSTYAVEQSLKLDGEIISADSMQIYRHMDIGTAKPTKKELQQVPHHLIDIVDPEQPFSVSNYVEKFKEAKATIESKGRLPIVVGGTGLYLTALLKGFRFPVLPAQPQIRQRLREEANAQGGQVLHDRLKKIDPVSAARLHPNDHFRVIRALEVGMISGKPLSAQQKKGDPILDQYRLQCLTAPREVIYRRIEERVDKMIQDGLIEEVQKLLAMGYNKNLTALKALGYKEVIEHLAGKYTKEELEGLIKQRTRNFAKRQMTWFRSFKNIEWIDIK
ncbi:tRNA (adenosine(37)-N6)-dimethylallyltransferase MiaA [Candidatus Margulisiibacteriota bacterium]